MRRKILLNTVLLVLFITTVSAQDNVYEAPGVEISEDTLTVELESHESGWATLALPINGQVPIEQITDDCSITDEIAYGYEGQGTSTEAINGMRGYAIQLNSDCTAEIETSSIVGTVNTDLPNTGWTVFSVPREMTVNELESNCDFNGFEGTNIFEITLDEGNIPLENEDVLEGTGLYWIRVTGNNCGLDMSDQPFDTDGDNQDQNQNEDGEAGKIPKPVSRNEILSQPYQPLKIDNNAERPIELPSCSVDDARIIEPDESENLESILEDEEYRVFCITPGDYRDSGEFTISEVSGTEDNPKWLRYYNPDVSDNLHPWNMADPETKGVKDRVIMDGITWKYSDNWRVDRIRFDSRVETWDLENFVFNRLMMYRSDSTVQVKIRNSDETFIQNSVLGKTQSQEECHSGADSNGISIRNTKGSSNKPYIIDNEIFDYWCGDGIQYTGSEEKVFGGVIQGNHIYRTEEYDGPVENGIDLKMGPADSDGSLDGISKDDWIIVENNKLWGEGNNIIYHHEEVSGIITRNNIMWDIQGNQFATYPKGSTTNNDWLFYDNIFYNTGGTFKARHVDDSYFARNIFVDSENSNGDSWAFAHWEDEDAPKNNEVTKNVFLSSGVGDREGENRVTDNAYYDSDPFEGASPAIEEKEASAANHEDLSLEVRPITGPETVRLPDVGVTEDSPHSEWFQ